MKDIPPYQYPPAPFQPGDWVKFEGQRYQVKASTHTHTQLAGVGSAIANWQLRHITPKKEKQK